MRRRSLLIGAAIAAIALWLVPSGLGLAAEKAAVKVSEETIALSQLPPDVKAALENASKGGKIEEIVKVSRGEKVIRYEADVIIDGKKNEIAIAPSGKVLRKGLADDAKAEGKKPEGAVAQEEKVTLDQVPAAVRKTLERECPGATIRDIAKEIEGGKTLYDFEVTREGRAFEFDIAADGEVLSREEQVELSQLPAAVRKTIERASKGGTIGTIMKANEAGKTSYEAEITIEGKMTEIAIAADGKLITAGAEQAEEKTKAGATKKGKAATTKPGQFKDTFKVNPTHFASTGKNTYFILEPGYVLKFKGPKNTELTVTVLDETKTINGVETRVVEERETKDGQLAEVSLNWFAISKVTGNVYYFGEDSKDYKDGKVVSQGGSWEAGKNDAKFGVMVYGKPRVGQKYYQEVAPKVAMDRAENVSLTETMEVPAGKFENCLKVEESSGLESGKEYKYYAPGVGLIKDGDFVLTSYGFEKGKGEKGKGEKAEKGEVKKPKGGKKGKAKKAE